MTFTTEKRNGTRIRRLQTSAAQLMLTVKATGGEFRMWQAVGGVAFVWSDRAGNVIGGWEENHYNRGVTCVVYRASDRISAPKPRNNNVRQECEY